MILANLIHAGTGSTSFPQERSQDKQKKKGVSPVRMETSIQSVCESCGQKLFYKKISSFSHIIHMLFQNYFHRGRVPGITVTGLSHNSDPLLLLLL